MAIKVERRTTGVAGAGGLPSVGFGAADAGSSLTRAGLSLLRQSQAKAQENNSLNDYLAGNQAAFERPVTNDDGTFTAPAWTDPAQSSDWNRGYVKGIMEHRFDVFQNGALDRVNTILTDEGMNAAQKQVALQDFGTTYMDKLQIHEAERGRWGNWLNNTLHEAGRKVVAHENAVRGRLEIEGAESRIKRRMDELTSAIETGNAQGVLDAQESINNDFDFLESRASISPDKRKIAQTQMYELARVTGMSRQVGGALMRMEVDPEKVDNLLDAIQTGADYKLEWTDRDGRKWEIDTKKLDVADPGLKDQLIRNLNGTTNRMKKIWSDMAENEGLLNFMETKDPSVPLSSEQKTSVNKMLEQIVQKNGVDNPQTWAMVTHWSGRAGHVPSTIVTSLVSMLRSGDEKQISMAAQAWNSIRNAQDKLTGKAIGNQLALSIEDGDRQFLDTMADGIGLGYTPAQIAAARDKMFSGDSSFRETTADALKAWGQFAGESDEYEKSFDAQLRSVWQQQYPEKRDWVQRGVENMTGLQIPNVTIGKTIGGVGIEYPQAATRMPPWWADAVKKAYVTNYMLDPSSPKQAMDLAIKQINAQTKVSPVFKDGAARLTPGLENIEMSDTWKEWAAERGKDLIERGDGMDQLEEFALQEMGLDDFNPLSPDTPMISMVDMQRIAKTGKPVLGENMKLHRIGGDNENPQFEVWFKDSDGMFLPVKAENGNNLLIQPAGEWRYRAERMDFDKRMRGLQGAQQGEIDKLQRERDEALMKKVNEYTRLNPGGLPGKDLIDKFDAEVAAEMNFDVEKEAIEQGFRERMDQLELSSPEPPVTPKTSTPDPIVRRVQETLGVRSGEEAVTPYQPTGEPTVNSPETGPWQGKVPPISSFLTEGKDKSHANLAPDFADPLARMLADAQAAGHDVKIFSGYRSVEHQRDLWNKALRKYGSAAAARKHVAPPGRSSHNHGGAADLSYAGSALDGKAGLNAQQRAAQQWVHANAGKYGLHFRMGHEPWHIERAKGGKVASVKDSATPARSGDPYQLLTVGQARGQNVAWTAAKAIDAVLPDGTGGHFLVNMASTESQFGEAPGTFRLKGDRGIWQINRGGAFAEVKRQLGMTGSRVQQAAAQLKEKFGLDVGGATWDDMDKPIYGAAFARLYMIARGKETIPTDVQTQAAIWKKYYNTVAGAGKVEHFVSKAVAAPQQTAALAKMDVIPMAETNGALWEGSIMQAAVKSLWGSDPFADEAPVTDPGVSMEGLFVSARTIPDVTQLEAFEKIVNDKHSKVYIPKSAAEDAMNDIVDHLVPRSHFEGDARLIMMNMVEQSKTNPIMRAALKHLSGKRLVMYPNVQRFGPAGHPMAPRGFQLDRQGSAYGYYHPENKLVVVPDPKTDPDAGNTLYHESLHKLFTEQSVNDKGLPEKVRDRLSIPHYEHALIYALTNEADSTNAKKVQNAKRVDQFLKMLIPPTAEKENAQTVLNNLRKFIAQDIETLKAHYGG